MPGNEQFSQVVTPFMLIQFDTKDIPYSIPIDSAPPYQDAEKHEITRFVNIIKETLRQNLNEIDKIRDVMLVYKNKKEDNTWYGRTYEGRLTKVHSPRNLIGKILPVKITDANLTALEGHFI